MRYHFEKRPIEAEFLIVTSPDLLVNLPVSSNPVPIAAEYNHPTMPWFHGPVPQLLPFAEVPEGYTSNSSLWVDGETPIVCRNISFHLFAQLLSLQYKVPVIDETGLSQRFNLDITVKRGEGSPVPTNLSEIRNRLKSSASAFRRTRAPSAL